MDLPMGAHVLVKLPGLQPGLYQLLPACAMRVDTLI